MWFDYRGTLYLIYTICEDILILAFTEQSITSLKLEFSLSDMTLTINRRDVDVLTKQEGQKRIYSGTNFT